MPIQQSLLRNYAAQAGFRKSAEFVNEAKARQKQTAFLSHSHRDETLAKGVQVFLQNAGWDVYIDWEDTAMPESPNRQTAQRIQHRIKELNWFLFLATENSMQSRWCPWEIGYADGVKLHDQIVILQTSDDRGRFFGNEYLQIYRYLDPSQVGGGYSLFRSASDSVRLAEVKL